MWLARVALLMKLGQFTVAHNELKAFGSFDSPDMYFDYYPDAYPGRTGEDGRHWLPQPFTVLSCVELYIMCTIMHSSIVLCYYYICPCLFTASELVPFIAAFFTACA